MNFSHFMKNYHLLNLIFDDYFTHFGVNYFTIPYSKTYMEYGNIDQTSTLRISFKVEFFNLLFGINYRDKKKSLYWTNIVF